MATPRLTPRERQVLCLLAEGYRYRDIAAALHISAHTVKMHVQHLLRKYGCLSRLQLTALAHPARGHRRCDQGAAPAPRAAVRREGR
jgi:DNA-binding CsgD family transcriptional regulator